VGFQLGLKGVDLYLIHGPWAIEHDDVEGVWDEMVRVREAGLSKYVTFASCARLNQHPLTRP
jgi:diketogulonate reductase-like aldo/keto reductase